MRSYQAFVLGVGLLTHATMVLAGQEGEGLPQSPGGETAPAPTSETTLPQEPASTPAVPQGKPLPPAGIQAKPGTSKMLPGQKPGKPGKKLVKKSKKQILKEELGAKRGKGELDAAVVGEAQVLPKNVFRGRYILRSVSAEKGYDSAGEKQDLGASLSALGHAVVVEYGITDKLVFQMITPYTSSNELVMNANTFKQSKIYETQYTKFVEKVAPTLIANNICSSLSACRTAIDNGLALGIDTPVELPTGETATVGANVPIRDAINSIILKSVEPQSGKTGLGDIQIGLGYNVYSSPLNVLTLGLGLRFPSGLFSNVADAYRTPGSGFLTTGMLLRYDLRLTPVILSLSHQFEYSLNKAKKTRSSLLSPSFLNGQDPTTDDPSVPGSGDGIANEMMIERKGLYHAGYVRLAYALGHLSKWLMPLAAYGYFSYAVDPEYHNQGHLYRKKEELYSASYALSFDGLAMNPMIPASLTYRRELSIGGRNAFLAPDSHYFTLTGYLKF